VDPAERCIFAVRKVMFTDGEHKFAVREHIFMDCEHKFTEHKYKIDNCMENFVLQKFPDKVLDGPKVTD
jgi:hypothetical protein